MKQAGAFLAVCVALLVAMALKGALLILPSPPAAPEGQGFDADRAMERLSRILGDQRPHPVDSDAADAVRERLLAELRTLGLEGRVTDDVTCNGSARERRINCARVRNLVATVGPSEGRHILLVSHYDSTPAGPGASDDGIGIATMLEIAHLLRGQRLTRPVTFLFNEGEESGLLGARAFLERDPLAARVDTLVNLESRGVNGPAIMFETSRPNGASVALFRAGASRPVGNSLSTDLYRLIPNSTDVVVFEERPWTILNFAVIGNETRYHSAGDTLEALDRRSLQHMGVQALGVTALAATEGTPEAGGERLYMDVLGLGLLVLPLLVGLVLLGVLALFFFGESWRRGALGRPLLAMLAAFAGAGLLAFAGNWIVQLLRPGDFWRAWPLVTTTAAYTTALAVCVAALLLVARTAERTRLRAAFWLFFVLLGGALCLIAPGAAVYFLLPPLLAALGMAAERRWSGAEQAGAVAAALALFLTFGPALHLFEELMNGGPLWAFAPLGAAIMLPALIELAPVLARLRTVFAVAIGFDLALLFWLAAALAPAYSEDRQQLFTIEYVWDEAARSGRYAVNNDGASVPFEADWARAELPYTSRIRWVAPAPPAPVAGPAVELVNRTPQGDGDRLRLRVQMNGAHSLSLIAPADSGLRAGGGGSMRPFGEGNPEQRYSLRCVGRSCDGAVLDLVVPRGARPELTLIGHRPGLPSVAAGLVQARPALARAQYGPDSTITIGRFQVP